MRLGIKEIHPVLPVQDVAEALRFYTEVLGFKILFQDNEFEPRYAGVRLEKVEIHLQWHDDTEWDYPVDRPLIRILCDDPDRVYARIRTVSGVESLAPPTDTSWGTRDLGLYDDYGNGIIFYRNIKNG
ncbi:VOC family protein [Robertkochia aurantiaca]|uniref:VOC family protein n=1 Tax=Robertkochia aurantiaca TaxID=2873700 RepID=UPI001CCF31DF|nr:VOC family protein [Robertkochia sp. 3YJGBD-33]